MQMLQNDIPRRDHEKRAVCVDAVAREQSPPRFRYESLDVCEQLCGHELRGERRGQTLLGQPGRAVGVHAPLGHLRQLVGRVADDGVEAL